MTHVRLLIPSITQRNRVAHRMAALRHAGLGRAAIGKVVMVDEHLGAPLSRAQVDRELRRIGGPR